MNHIFLLSVEDAQILSQERIGRRLTEDELRSVRRGVEFGLEHAWSEVLQIAIDEATLDSK